MVRHAILTKEKVKNKKRICVFHSAVSVWLLSWPSVPSQGLKRIVCNHCLCLLASDSLSVCGACLWVSALHDCLLQGWQWTSYLPNLMVSVLVSFDLSQTLDTFILFEILPPPEFPTPFHPGFSPLSGPFLLGLHPSLRVGGLSRPGRCLPVHSPWLHGQPLASPHSKATCLSSVPLPSAQSDCPVSGPLAAHRPFPSHRLKTKPCWETFSLPCQCRLLPGLHFFFLLRASQPSGSLR